MTRRTLPALVIATVTAAAACIGQVDPGTGGDGPGNGEPDNSAYIYDDEALRSYELRVDPDDWDRLNATALDEQYVPATLVFEGREWAQVGLRYKGNYSLTTCFDGPVKTCDKVSMKVKVNEYVADQRFHGLKRLNFHSMFNDESLLRDRLAYSLYRDMGVPAPRVVHATLSVNGEALGLFALVEQVDGRFTRNQFADGGKGNLYKEVWPTHSQPDRYREALKTNEDEQPSFDRMIRFADALRNTTDDGFAAVLDTWMDTDATMKTLAVDRAIGNWDGPVSSWYCFGECKNHNYYWYEETDADRVWLIPWDMNDTFKPFLVDQIRGQGLPRWDEPEQRCDLVTILGGTTARPPSCDDFLHRLATVTREQYRSAARELLAGPFDLDRIQVKLDRWSAQIATAVSEDEHGPGTGAWEQGVRSLRDYARQLRDSFSSSIED